MVPSQPSSLPLGPIDHIVPKTYTVRLFFFPDKVLDLNTAPQIFRSGLAKLLTAIPELGGTVQRIHDAEQKRGIQVTEPWRSADEIFSVMDLTAHDHLDYSKLREHHFPSNRCDPEIFAPPLVLPTALEMLVQACALGKPVLLVQYNILKGGAALVYHAFTDGNGVATIARAYAACCQGVDSSSLLSKEILNRQRAEYCKGAVHHGLDEFGLWTVKPEKTGLSAYMASVLSKIMASILRLTLKFAKWTSFNIWPYQNVDFFFPTSKLTELKSMVMQTRSDKDASQWVSTVDTLSSLLTCCLVTAMAPRKKVPTSSSTSQSTNDKGNSDEKPDVLLIMVLSARRSLDPPLPSGSLGNLLDFESATASSSALTTTESAVADFAFAIRRCVQRVDGCHFRRFSAAISAIPNIFDRFSSRRRSEDGIQHIFALSSWKDQHFYDLDWGEGIGHMEKIRYCALGLPSLCLIMPEIKGDHFAEEEKGLEVTVGLTNGQRQKLRGDEFFRRFATFREE
ncbi:MAG: hypothetical protein L6R38_008872 [Xanthoria sp. 2 TBL-2021]|nr:MAG: hypothetical protein L6R38_008872 [Xanthoria sp. 2 TBL-2021]